MNTDLLHRATFVLDRATADRLTAISARLGVSRSALVRDVLQEPIELMHRWVTALPENPTAAEADELMGRVFSEAEAWLDGKAAQLDLVMEPASGHA
jgi:predicted transcriptional regulator